MGLYYLTVSADADDIVTSSIAIAASSVVPFGAGAPLSGSYITTSALSATPNSKVLAVSGGDLSLVEGTSAISINSSFLRTGSSPLALALSGSYEQLSAVQFCAVASGGLFKTTYHSEGTPDGCPIPQPYLWVSSSDGTATTSGNFGNGATVSGVSSTGHMEWDTGNDRLVVSAAGMYRASLVGVMTTAANQNIVLQLYVNDVQQFVAGEFVHGLVDPDVVTIDWVGFLNAGDNLRVTHASSSNSNFTVGSTLTIVRLA